MRIGALLGATGFLGWTGQARTGDDQIMSPLVPTRTTSTTPQRTALVEPYVGRTVRPGVKRRRWARATQATREAVRDGGLYLRRERRHTSGVFFNHYSQSAVIEARGGALLVQGIQGYFDAAVHGAVVVTPEAEQLLLDGQECDALSVDMAASLLSGDLDGPHTACRNPEDSPFEPAGETCGQATTGKCFGCSNALITQSHLPAAILIRDLSDPRRAADPAAWLATWKDIHEFVTAIVLPAFSEEQVAAASELVASVPVDLGVANDMRGANQDV